MTASHAHCPRTIGLISNANSRRNQSALARVESIVANHPHIHHRATRSEAEISSVLAEFSRLGVDHLAINGGDGTMSRVITRLLEDRAFADTPRILLLPGGTTNMNAGDVGMRGALPKSVAILARWANGAAVPDKVVTRPILRVAGASDGQVICGMFFGTGTIISGIEYCTEKIHTRGIRDELAPGLVALRTMWGIARREPYFSDPTSMDITLSPHAVFEQRPVVQLLVTSLRRLFLGLTPFWGNGAGDLRCTWLEKPTRHVLRAFPGLLRGRPGRFVKPENGYHSHNTGSLQLAFDGTFVVDGEMHPASRDHGPLTISNAGLLEFVRLGRN